MTTALPSPLLVTGGADFIGANFVHRAVASGAQVVTLDALNYSGNRASLTSLDVNPIHTFVQSSIADRALAIDWPVEAPVLPPRYAAVPALANTPILPTYRTAP